MKIVLILVVLVLLSGCGFLFWQNSQVPELGHVNGQLKPLSANPNGVSTHTDDPSKQVAPWPFKEDLATTMAAIRHTLNQVEGAEIVEDQSNYLRVVFVTPLMRYRDDAEFYLDEASQQVHFRSASRAGKSDLGLNRERFDKLTAIYNQ